MADRRLQRRVNATLASLVSAVAVAVAVSFVLHERVHESSEAVRRAEGGLVAVLRLSIAVREAYAHQAHTFILNDASHGDHYGEAAALMLRASDNARSAAGFLPDAARALAVVAQEARLLDEQFRTEVLPRVGRDREAIVKPSEEAIFRVERMQTHIDEAASALARAIEDAHARTDSATRTSRVVTLTALCVAVLVALGSAWSLDRALSRPLARLQAATEGLQRGDLRTRVDADIAARSDELGALARRFNDMAGALAEREHKLIEAERLAAVGKLAAGVAHEINNPLQVILGTARLLERDVDERGKKDVATIVAEVERCKVIVGGLLDLSRRPRLELAEQDLRVLCEETAGRLQGAIAAELRVDGRGDGRARADGPKLRQVLTNLLLNASQAGAGRIELDVDGGAADAVTVRVSDDGAGVPSAIASRLFEPFVTGRADGTGLGLAVSRAIVKAHGGTLEHVPRARGAAFVITLPRSGPAGEVAS